jgi:hypothetical protein
MNDRILTHLAWVAICCVGAIWAAAAPAAEPACGVVCDGTAVELHSSAFVFRLDTSDGLRAVAWENRLTGRTLDLGRGVEVEFDLGLPGQPLQTPRLRVVKRPAATSADCGRAVFELESDDPSARVSVTYHWDAAQSVLHKSVTITNRGEPTWNRLLNIRLGRYETPGVRLVDRPASGPHCIPAPREFPNPDGTQVERGFPVYAAEEFFLTLAHPAGVAEAADGKILLRQYPGVRLESGATLKCLETVYGVAPAGQARTAFLRHVTSRMRRVVRGHDRPYAIFEPFGARPGGSFDETEAFVLDSIAKVAEGQRQTGLRFDAYSVDFWVDYRGTLKECDPQRFPQGLVRIKEELHKLGTPLGLWIDSSWELWSIGGNPQVQGCLNTDPQRPDTVNQVSWGRKSFCRATEPIRSLYVEAFRHHIRENGVRLLKFDNLANVCQNPNHEHLPGVYSTEPIMDAVIEFLGALDGESRDVFLMLYWGYRSPWWLLHGDTLFDSGLNIEAASPSTQPAPHARDSVTQKLDQAQWHASDVPALGKDSLGVWLSDWGWNSQIGKERWQQGFIMDLCRGSLLAQPWSDTPWLTPPERQQMAVLVDLLRARPECFGHPRFVVGNPQRNEPYGYCCTDGRRAIVALNNCSWRDHTLTLQLNPEWGLPAGQAWGIYRWYPDPAELRGAKAAFCETAAIALRPFEVVLLEIVPAGQKPSLDRTFVQRPIPTRFSVPSCDLAITARQVQDEPVVGEAAKWTVLKPTRAVSSGGASLIAQPDGSVLAGGKIASPDTYTVTADTTLASMTAIRLEALPDDTLPGHGPGRAVNGNFALTGIRVKASPCNKPDQTISVTLRNPQADFAQDSYGGWPVAAALDGDPKTGWSIDPEEAQPHEAVFEMEPLAGFEGGATLTVELDQGDREHSLGRFRLSVSTATPVPGPQRRGRRLVVQGDVPPSPDGGLLVVTVEMSRDGQPIELHNMGRHLSAAGQLDGKPIVWQPVLGTATYPSCWQAWRLPLSSGAKPSAFELVIAPSVGTRVDLRCEAHFLPSRP